MSDPNWTHGFSMEFLKEAAALFRAEIKPHCYGAFGLPKETDVAAARATDRLTWTRAGVDQMQGVAIFRIASQASKQRDFTGRAATIERGDLFISALAGTEAAIIQMVQS